MRSVLCSTCRFWVPGQVMGACRRYPQVQNKHERDWCGEHQYAKNEFIEERPQPEEQVDEAKPRKPGRPRKNEL